MSRNTILLGRWLAIAAETRLARTCAAFSRALLCMVLLYPHSAWAGKPAPPSGWTTVALNTDSHIQSNVQDISDAGDVAGWLLDDSTSEWLAVL
jgi:hypothetical protein